MKKIYFIGGFGGTGTRVISIILESLGYYVGGEYKNEPYDFGGTKFRDVMFRYQLSKNPTEIKKHIDWAIKESGDQDVAIKHGQLMFFIDELRELYPGCEYIHVHRDPFDNVMNQYFDPKIVGNNPVQTRFGGLPNNLSIEENAAWADKTNQVCIDKADFDILLEDLVDKKDEVVSSFLNYIKSDAIPSEFFELIKKPKSMGRYKRGQ